MTRRTASHLSVRPIALACVAAASLWSTAALAQSASEPPAQSAPPSTSSAPEPAVAPATPASTGDIRRLSDEERWAILNNNTEEKAAAARGELPGSSLAPGVHGEVGVMIGSHGTRSVYGTAAIPLGDNAGAVISFESSRFGYPR